MSQSRVCSTGTARSSRPRLRRVGRPGRVHRRRDRGHRGAEPGRPPGRRGDQPGRRRPRLLRHRRRAPGAQAHDRASWPRHGAHVDLWLFCPYHPDGIVEGFARSSADRKPGAGMALAAAQALDLDLAASWVVGDRPADVGLARAVGAHPLYVGPAGSAAHGRRLLPRPRRRGRAILAARRRRARRRPRSGSRPPVRRRRDAYGGAYVAELARAFDTIDLDEVARGRRLLTTPTCGTRPSSPAATAARPPSPTTCSATTSRVSATAPG